MNKNKKIIIGICGAVFIGSAVLVYFMTRETVVLRNPTDILTPTSIRTSTKITTEKGVIELEHADTNAERIQGLSGRPRLDKNTGLLFTFEMSDLWGIWMKDMLFPIDIIWLDKEYRIVGLEKNVSPDTYPQAFKPVNPALYVVEINAGEADSHGLKINDILTISK